MISFYRNFGQTAAMMAGIDYAQGDVIVPLDGDLQNDPADIPRDSWTSLRRVSMSCQGGVSIEWMLR